MYLRTCASKTYRCNRRYARHQENYHEGVDGVYAALCNVGAKLSHHELLKHTSQGQDFRCSNMVEIYQVLDTDGMYAAFCHVGAKLLHHWTATTTSLSRPQFQVLKEHVKTASTWEWDVLRGAETLGKVASRCLNIDFKFTVMSVNATANGQILVNIYSQNAVRMHTLMYRPYAGMRRAHMKSTLQACIHTAYTQICMYDTYLCMYMSVWAQLTETPKWFLTQQFANRL